MVGYVTVGCRTGGVSTLCVITLHGSAVVCSKSLLMRFVWLEFRDISLDHYITLHSDHLVKNGL